MKADSRIMRVLAVATLGLATGQICAQQVVPIHLIGGSGANQWLPVSTLRPERFALRVLHAQTGVPRANVRLHVGVNISTCPIARGCVAPPLGTYGRLSPDLGRPGYPQAIITTGPARRSTALHHRPVSGQL